MRSESPFKTFQDFVAAAKAKPGTLNLAGSGTNSANHAAHARLNKAAGITTTYVAFKESTLTEWDFLARLTEMTGCYLLLDVNNIYVSAFNHGFDPKTYIDGIPVGRVVQIHLAGHTRYDTYIIDTHTGHVIDEVWSLYEYTCRRFGEISTMVEWDQDIPDFETVHAEAMKAADVLEAACA